MFWCFVSFFFLLSASDKSMFSHNVWKSSKNVAFGFWHFPHIFVLLNVTCLATLFDRKLQVFKNSPKWINFGIFNELLSTQNVNVARFARNVKCDFFCDFQTLWTWLNTLYFFWRLGIYLHHFFRSWWMRLQANFSNWHNAKDGSKV